MDKPSEKLFCRLVAEGKTLRAIRRGMKSAGCDLAGYSETRLVKEMLRVRRGYGPAL